MDIRLWAKLSILAWTAFILASFGIGFITAKYFQHFALDGSDVQEVVVEIPMGSSLRQVSKLLAKAKVVRDPKIFYWYLRLGRLDGDRMQAGFYQFSGQITPKEAADRLLLGFDPSFKLVFKEGETLATLASRLEELKLCTRESFLEAMNSPEVIELVQSPLAPRKSIEDVGGIEGYLFPDTYYFSQQDSPLSIIKKMHARLLSMLGQDMLVRIKEQNSSLHEILTLASIVEKEARDEAERSLIASVYKNRLKLKMRLQADPTVIYGIKGYDGKIRKKDLETYHPYNTYRINGLPPGPIASAGIDSIKAALWPMNSDYLYFVAKNDGTHVFCRDLDCHNQAVRTWQLNYFREARKK